MWNAYCLFKPTDFLSLCDKINPLWSLPRTGEQQRPRKHGVEACLFAVLGILSTGMSDPAMEAVVEMPHSLIGVEFERILKILDVVLADQLFLMDSEEKAMCVGAAKSNPFIMYYIDGCDCAIQIAEKAWLYITQKKNVKKRTAFRAQVLVDS